VLAGIGIVGTGAFCFKVFAAIGQQLLTNIPKAFFDIVWNFIQQELSDNTRFRRHASDDLRPVFARDGI
jgi:hypothetical protein